jgi:hypothetical protein
MVVICGVIWISIWIIIRIVICSCHLGCIYGLCHLLLSADDTHSPFHLFIGNFLHLIFCAKFWQLIWAFKSFKTTICSNLSKRWFSEHPVSLVHHNPSHYLPAISWTNQ